MTEQNGTNPRPIAAAVIVRDGSVLMIRRIVAEGTLLWAFPSGEVEEGETPELAASRETGEEVGVVVEPQVVLGERIHPATGRRMVYVACAWREGEPQVLDDDEIDQTRWVPLSEVAEVVPTGFHESVQAYLDVHAVTSAATP